MNGRIHRLLAEDHKLPPVEECQVAGHYFMGEDVTINDISTDIVRKILDCEPTSIKWLPVELITDDLYANLLAWFKENATHGHVGLYGVEYSAYNPIIHRLFIDMIRHDNYFISRIPENHIDKILEEISKGISGYRIEKDHFQYLPDITGVCYNRHLKHITLYEVFDRHGNPWDTCVYSPVSDEEAWAGGIPPKIGPIYGRVLTWSVDRFLNYPTSWWGSCTVESGIIIPDSSKLFIYGSVVLVLQWSTNGRSAQISGRSMSYKDGTWRF